jgi:hypothetical protein
MRRIFGSALQRRHDHRLDLIADRARAPRTLLVHRAVRTPVHETPTHLPTVAGTFPNLATACVLFNPSAQANTIFDRNASDGADFARRDQRSNCSRSSLGQLQHSLRPTRPHHPRFYELQYEFLAQD